MGDKGPTADLSRKESPMIRRIAAVVAATAMLLVLAVPAMAGG